MNKYPHGQCQCPQASGMCCGGLGPAAFRVTRNGTTLLLCTRCDMTSDTDKQLLVTGDEPADLYVNFDALGAFCIMATLAEQQKALKV